jgi:hypothetical protein
MPWVTSRGRWIFLGAFLSVKISIVNDNFYCLQVLTAACKHDIVSIKNQYIRIIDLKKVIHFPAGPGG